MRVIKAAGAALHAGGEFEVSRCALESRLRCRRREDRDQQSATSAGRTVIRAKRSMRTDGFSPIDSRRSGGSVCTRKRL